MRFAAMTFLDAWVRTASAKALGWTLLHSLWEGAAIALALAIVLAISRSSRVRYAAACFAMLGLLAGFGATLYRLMPREITRAAAVRTLPIPVNPPLDDRRVANHRTPWDASELPPWLTPIWLAGVLLFQLRCLASWAAAGRMRRIGVCGAPSEWIEKLGDLQARLRMTRPVTLLESCFAEVPVVIGHLRPVILMPLGLLAGLPVGQIEAILLHELAHIRRADYLVNLMQTLVEGLFFYHPAAWWISSSIRAERENCCDDLVVLTNGDAHEYARALAALAENRWTLRETALAATGGNLVKRIRRVLAQPEGPRITIAPVLSVGILVVTGAVALTAWQTPARSAPTTVTALPVASAALVEPGPLLVAKAQTAPAASPQSHAVEQEHGDPASRYQRWLNEEVPYIITDRERADFKGLQTDADRDQFIKAFWERRNPTPGTPRNEYKEEHYRRIAYSNDRFSVKGFPGWKTDRGRIYIQYGPPDEIDSHPNGGRYDRPPEQGGGTTETYPFEQWRYRLIDGIGKNVILEFVDKARSGEFRLTTDPSEKDGPSSKPPDVKLSYKDLEAIAVTGRTMYNALPIKVRVSYTPLTLSAVLVQITVQFDTKDLYFQDKENVSTATINVSGRISTLARRPLSPFEDVVSVTQPTETLPKLIEANPAQIYQKTLPLQPGRYRLNIAAKDLVAKNSGIYEMIFDVPQGTPQLP
jgi:GWxTD domain-containing protein